jgi:heme exporter protein D
MAEFLDMGGYGAYIWPCYGASVLVIGALVWQSLSAHRRAQADITRLEKDAGGGE